MPILTDLYDIPLKGKIFVTSDTHLSHTNIIEYCGRPFETAEEMDEEIMKRWNSVVRDRDMVFHLGDVSMPKCLKHPEEIRQKINRLKGRKILILGNHDREPELMHSMGFAENYSMKVLRYKDRVVVMSHLPYVDVVDILSPDDKPVYLCGHVHEKWLFSPAPARPIYRETENGSQRFSPPVYMNMSVEKWDYTPVRLDEAIKVYEGQTSAKNRR